MSWEAMRLTSRTPSEVRRTLGPQGVDELIRRAWADCWRQTPVEQRSVASVARLFLEVVHRNLRVWNAIRKPTPQAFFADLLPHEADGHVRQALVTCWIMLPRGKRSLAAVSKVVWRIVQRNLAALQEDERMFTSGLARRSAQTQDPLKVPARRKSSRARKAYP